MSKVPRVLLVSKSKKGFQAKAYREAAQKLNIELDVCTYDDIVYHNKGFYLLSKGSLLEFSHFILAENQRRHFLVNAIFNYLELHKKRVLNADSYKLFAGNYDKLQQLIAFDFQGIAMPDSCYPAHLAGVDYKIVKPINASQGQGVQLAGEVSPAENQENLIAQQRITASFDLRVIVLNNKIIGAMKRENQDSLVNNFSAGGSVAAYELSAQEADLAVKAASALKLEYCGVDIMTDQPTQSPYVLEVNRGSQFKGFQMCYPEIKVAELVLNYLTTK